MIRPETIRVVEAAGAPLSVTPAGFLVGMVMVAVVLTGTVTESVRPVVPCCQLVTIRPRIEWYSASTELRPV